MIGWTTADDALVYNDREAGCQQCSRVDGFLTSMSPLERLCSRAQRRLPCRPCVGLTSPLSERANQLKPSLMSLLDMRD